ncbi:MAG: type IV pilus modification protein PilV [Aquabacterium sp.]|uniref:type IV pilus modification protein PilV n=1 Tax=Aquabacterium sp. TaxID=1872578 RepID=UPI003BC03665
MRQLNRGGSLIEALVSTVLLSMGAVGMLGMQGRALAYGHDSQSVIAATLLAQDLVARIRANPPEDLSSSPYLHPDAGLTDAAEHITCHQADTHCTHAQLAAADLRQWLEALTQQLSDGAAHVQLDTEHVDVWVAWRGSEGSEPSGAACPPGHTLHAGAQCVHLQSPW